MDTYEDVHKTRQDFLIVHAAVIPTNVLPAPHGSTIMPDRARLNILQHSYSIKMRENLTNPLPNILLKLVS